MGKRLAFRHARTMAVIIDVIVPIFAIILAGNVAARTRLFGDDASEAWSRFVYYVAGPVLAVVSLYRTPVEDFFNIPFLGALCGGVVMTLSLSLLVATRFFRESLTEYGLHGMCTMRVSTGAHPSLRRTGGHPVGVTTPMSRSPDE